MSLTPEKSTRYAGWHAVQHWLALHLLNVAPRTYVSVDLANEGAHPEFAPLVRLACTKATTPDDWAAEVAAVWEDCPTTWAVVPGSVGTTFANVAWRTDDGVNVNVFSPHAADLTPYREALVAAGVLRAEVAEQGIEVQITNYRPSSTGVDGVDANVEVRLTGPIEATLTGEITVMPAQFDGRWGAWGEPDHWASNGLLGALKGARPGGERILALQEINAAVDQAACVTAHADKPVEVTE